MSKPLGKIACFFKVNLLGSIPSILTPDVGNHFLEECTFFAKCSRPTTFLHMTKDISMTAPILPLPCFIAILVTVFLPEKVVQ